MTRSGESGRDVTRAVVLAAGRGTRLGPLTADRPKPMVSVAGRPALEILLQGLASTCIHDVLVVVGYRREMIEEFFGDGSRWGCRIEYAVQEHANGTGAALRLAHPWAAGAPVLVSYGDILTDPAHYTLLMDAYRTEDASVIVGINPMEDPSAGAAVYRDGDRVMRVVEKPPAGSAHSGWNLAGVSVYGPPVWPALDRLQPSPRGEYELTDAITGLIAAGEPVLARELTGFWSDIGTPETLAAAERHFGCAG